MFLKNLNQYNFLLAEHFNFYPLMPFITESKNHTWKMEHFEIDANEVIFSNTGSAEEIVIVISGCGGMTMNGETSSLIKTGDLIHISKNTIRSFANINEEEPLQVVCISIE